jgi:hypothetical protein
MVDLFGALFWHNALIMFLVVHIGALVELVDHWVIVFNFLVGAFLLINNTSPCQITVSFNILFTIFVGDCSLTHVSS